jgi:NAD(P)-dependent dehydrogenase (short-subunit alcohol dehydrogenase family)
VSALVRLVDAALEVTVVGSFSRLGYQARRRLGGWGADGDGADLQGRTVLITGATSGIGRAAAEALARRGASVQLLARNEGKAARTRDEIAAATGAQVGYDVADLADFDALRAFAERFLAAHDRLDALVHNAGALSRRYQQAADGTELTLASHVLGPFLLTSLLLPALRAAAPGRVVTVSSGGMYTQRLDLDRLEMAPDDYDGTVAYARAKRAQVVLNRVWAERTPTEQVVFHAMHPGWVDTPGIRTGLPTFHRVMRPLLRTPEQGADTVVWLASAPESLGSSGEFWHDRHRRGEHRLPWTRRGDDPDSLWSLCTRRTGASTPVGGQHRPR